MSVKYSVFSTVMSVWLFHSFFSTWPPVSLWACPVSLSFCSLYLFLSVYPSVFESIFYSLFAASMDRLTGWLADYLVRTVQQTDSLKDKKQGANTSASSLELNYWAGKNREHYNSMFQFSGLTGIELTGVRISDAPLWFQIDAVSHFSFCSKPEGR